LTNDVISVPMPNASVEKDGRANQQQFDLKGADRLGIDERDDIDGWGILCRSSAHARNASLEKPAICL
jgi:hypothetical protein